MIVSAHRGVYIDATNILRREDKKYGKTINNIYKYVVLTMC